MLPDADGKNLLVKSVDENTPNKVNGMLTRCNWNECCLDTVILLTWSEASQFGISLLRLLLMTYTFDSQDNPTL